MNELTRNVIAISTVTGAILAGLVATRAETNVASHANPQTALSPPAAITAKRTAVPETAAALEAMASTLAQLTQKLARMESDQQEMNTQMLALNEGLAAPALPEESFDDTDEYPSLEDREREDVRVAEEREEAIHEALTWQEADAGTTDQLSQSLQNAFAVDTLPGHSIGGVDCRETFCAINIHHDAGVSNEDGLSAARRAIDEASTGPVEGFYRVTTAADGSKTTHLYVSTNGAELPVSADS